MASLLPLFILFFVVISQVECKFGNAQTSSPSFEFIKDLQGYERGSKAQGLHDLKLYLARYGYLNYPNYHAQNLHFDQELENALKSYQNFFKLDATGALDAPTVSQMDKPRCGYHDIKAHQHNTKPALHITSHYKVAGCVSRWPSSKTNLTYAFNMTFPKEYIPPFVRAFSTWDSALDLFTFSRVDDFEGADLKVSMVGGDEDPFVGLPGALAVGNPPTDGRIIFNANGSWYAGPETVPDSFDIGSVALHEIGHTLGLDHSQDINAIMFPSFGPGYIKGLGLDDIEGLKFFYGDNSCNEVPPGPTPIP